MVNRKLHASPWRQPSYKLYVSVVHFPRMLELKSKPADQPVQSIKCFSDAIVLKHTIDAKESSAGDVSIFNIVT